MEVNQRALEQSLTLKSTDELRTIVEGGQDYTHAAREAAAAPLWLSFGSFCVPWRTSSFDRLKTNVTDNIAPLAALAAIIILAGAVFLRRVATSSAMNRLTSPEGFAGIVVGEIRMYHGRAVETAFQQSAIYRTFKDDIDRSRKMFLQKFPDAETAFYATRSSPSAD